MERRAMMNEIVEPLEAATTESDDGDSAVWRTLLWLH